MTGYLQYLLPKKLLTRLAGGLASKRLGLLTTWFIRAFVKHYAVNMKEAIDESLNAYPTFNAFFTRRLKPGARVVDDSASVVVSPADGVAGALGRVRHGLLLQVKGRYYTLAALLAGKFGSVERFEGGRYLTAYLSPKDYHRVHMPVSGNLRQMTYIPGSYYSVNASSIKSVDAVFAKNERVVCQFDTPQGELIIILVGAMIVGSMVTSWHGQVESKHGQMFTKTYSPNEVGIQKGDEIGYFQLGSTVVMLAPEGVIEEFCVKKGDSLKMGQKIGYSCRCD